MTGGHILEGLGVEWLWDPLQPRKGKMPNEIQTYQFIDEIMECTLQALSENPAFDDETLVRLKELAGSSGLKNFEIVLEALSAGEEK